MVRDILNALFPGSNHGGAPWLMLPQPGSQEDSLAAEEIATPTVGLTLNSPAILVRSQPGSPRSSDGSFMCVSPRAGGGSL